MAEAGLREHVWPLFSRVLGSNRKEIYLANHSLGRPLDQTALDVQRGLDLWYERLDGAWDDDAWPAEIDLFRARVAALIGLSDAKAVVPKTSGGQGLRAVLNALRVGARVVATRGEFDSIDFILKTYAAKGALTVDWIEPQMDPNGVPIFDVADILDRIQPGVDLVVVSAVFFGTGQVLNGIELIATNAHALGALLLVDAYHAAGVIPLRMEAEGIDFMIGGSYKYTRGGPGACWLALHPSVLSRNLRTLDTGWFAKKNPFGYARPDVPEYVEGGDGWLESTPPVLTVYQAAAGLQFTLDVGVERLREYNLGQQAVLRSAFREGGVRCFLPARPEEFGAFTLVPSGDASGLARALKSRGVNTDARGGFVRFGPDVLNSEEELVRAARITGEVCGC